MIRHDIHRPSAIIPSEYHFVAFECVPKSGDTMGDAMYQMAERRRIRAHMEKTGGTYSRHAHGGNCMVCGNANAIYTVLFHHLPTNVYVRMGQDCAAKCEMGYDEDSFNSFRRNMDNERLNRAGKGKAQVILSDMGLSAAWEVYAAPDQINVSYEQATVRDIVGKLVQYGNISEKAANFVRSLLVKIENAGKTAAERAAAKALAKPVPVTNGRSSVEGTILALKTVEGMYGVVTKMLVEHSDGWKVWGTAPAGAERGQKVKFMARVEVSPDDSKFGFFSRPSKFEVL